MSILNHEKEDKLSYAVSHSNETPQVLDIEEPRLRLMPMEGRCPKSQYICSDVKLGESNDAVPRKGLFERGDKKIEENNIFVNVFYSRCYFIVTKFPSYKLHPRKLE